MKSSMKNNFPSKVPPKSYPALFQVQVQDIPDKSVETYSTYWSWTLALTTFPFILWGCPFYLVARPSPKNNHVSLLSSTGGWLKRMFDCCSFPFSSIVTVLLIFPTISINAYVLYIFWDMFAHLFISGTYELKMLGDLLGLIRYVPVIIPLDYVWFRGFKVNNMIILLNLLHSRYGGVGCATFRIRLALMVLAIFGVHVIRYFSYERYELTRGKSVLEVTQNALEFSVDIFCTLLLPVYCTFCYAIRFQLFTIKAIVYRLISRRVVPEVLHLSMVKILYTQAADHIDLMNSIFSLYISVALIITFIGTIFDANNLWKAVLKLYTSIVSTPGTLTTILTILAREMPQLAGNINGTTTEEETGGESMVAGEESGVAFTAEDVRKINADIACIVIIYGLMFFTIWQAVITNDIAREVHVWLNDFVTGGGGSDVKSVLLDLGVPRSTVGRRKDSGDSIILIDHREEGGGLIWAKNSITDCGVSDEFLTKFRMLKGYLHSRMQLEKPALLNITLVGLIVPPLSGRLRNYQLIF